MKTINQLKVAHDKAKNVDVGSSVICPVCGTSLIKKYSTSIFCNNQQSNCGNVFWRLIKRSKKRGDSTNMRLHKKAGLKEKIYLWNKYFEDPNYTPEWDMNLLKCS